MSPYASLAKRAVETYLKTRKIIDPPLDLPERLLEQKGGVFVTIHNIETHQLRGCIGTYLATYPNLALEIIRNAIAAATSDWRFTPITTEELPQLAYEVSILTSPGRISSCLELDPKKFGILVQSSGKSGLLLPDLESITTIRHQLEIALKKARINPVSEKISLYRFKTEKYQ